MCYVKPDREAYKSPYDGGVVEFASCERRLCPPRVVTEEVGLCIPVEGLLW